VIDTGRVILIGCAILRVNPGVRLANTALNWGYFNIVFCWTIGF